MSCAVTGLRLADWPAVQAYRRRVLASAAGLPQRGSMPLGPWALSSFSVPVPTTAELLGIALVIGGVALHGAVPERWTSAVQAVAVAGPGAAVPRPARPLA